MKRLSFVMLSVTYFNGGRETRWIQRDGLSLEQQRTLLNQCIVGYDPYHPDSGNPEGFVFKTPDKYRYPVVQDLTKS